MCVEQPNASTQYEDWKKYPETYKEPTNEDWLAEIAALIESREGWKREYRLINAAQLQAEEEIKKLHAEANLNMQEICRLRGQVSKLRSVIVKKGMNA